MKLRIRYSKCGRMQFLSHLELINMLEQLFRRNQIPLRYTEGFNPRVDLSFALPLPVGIQSTMGIVDVECLDVAPSKFLELHCVPEGFSIDEVKITEDGPLMNKVCMASYYFFGDLDRIEEALKKEELPYLKKTKRGQKTVDAKELIVSSERRSDCYVCTFYAGQERNLKAIDFLRAISDDMSVQASYDVVQFDLLDEEGVSLWKR
ncbi:TIGR03936 family radical SAM-associated protein [Guggenheimella bovis]